MKEHQLKETQSALNVMTDAVEGAGIAYWAEAKNVRRNKNNDVTSFYVRANDNEPLPADPKLREWHRVDASKVVAAATAVRNGLVDIRRDIAAQFVPPYDYDGEGVDCLIQVIAFGEIVFG